MTADPGGRDAVRQTVMQRLRADIRERQMRGQSLAAIRAWIERQEAEGMIAEEEAAVAELVIRHYTTAEVNYYPGRASAPGWS